MLFYLFNGRNATRTCRHFGISRQTFYCWLRRFDRHDLSTLEERSHRPRNIRQPTWTSSCCANNIPCWGKDKLVVLLAREKLFLSVSMVGRILSALNCTNPQSPPSYSDSTANCASVRGPFASLKYWLIKHPGDLVEVDTKEIRMHRGALLKHFSARDVVSRWDVVEVHRRATSLAAARFLDTLLEHFPLPVKALQIDGGSEFAAQSELACQQKQLPLFVLPPKSPKLNAHVERSHRTHHEEFYQAHADSDQPPHLNHQLRHWEHTYNCVRPHQSVAYLTPLEFVTRGKNNPRKAKCH